MRIDKSIYRLFSAVLIGILLAGCAGTDPVSSDNSEDMSVSGLLQDEDITDGSTSDGIETDDPDAEYSGAQAASQGVQTIRGTDDVKLHFLCVTADDEGRDVILIESGGEFGFVDCGAYSERNQTLAIMDELGVTPDNLKFIIGTHAHGDHIGFMDYLIYKYRPERIYLAPFTKNDLVRPEEWTDNAWKNAMSQADACGVPVVSAFNEGYSEEPWKKKKESNRYTASPHFTFGNAQIDIYNYSREYHKAKVENANDTSLAVKVTAGGHTALLTGDLSNAPGRGADAGYDETAVANEVGHVDILKLPHHGSGFDGTNLPEDLQKFSASYLIQTGPTHFLFTGGNKYGSQRSFSEILREVKMGAVYVSTFWYDKRIIGQAGLSAITFNMSTLENNIPGHYCIMPLDQNGRSYMFRGGRLADFTMDAGDVYISNGKKNEPGWITADDIVYMINGESKIVGASGQKWERFR